MSRIGKQPVQVPPKAEASVDGNKITIKGPLGELDHELPPELTVAYEGDAREVQVDRRSNDRRSRALHGLHRSLISNMVEGVTEGFQKDLELYGTGYSVNMRGSDLVLQVGFCHEVVVEMPEGITAEVDQTNAQLDRPATFSVKGADKQAVGQLAASIRDIRPPEPYKGKGIRYVGEYVRRKEGKAFTGTGA
jgi:large subunit ribosomal protein L6